MGQGEGGATITTSQASEGVPAFLTLYMHKASGPSCQHPRVSTSAWGINRQQTVPGEAQSPSQTGSNFVLSQAVPFLLCSGQKSPGAFAVLGHDL